MKVDSAGRAETTRVAMPIPPPNTVAFVSGIATIGGTLAAFANGRLRTYGQVTGLTKTDGWTTAPSPR